MANKRASGETAPELFLAVSEERSNGYFHLRAAVVTRKYESMEYHAQGADDTYGDGPLYSGLRASCQGDERSRLRTDGEVVYGYRDVEYESNYSGCDLRRAKRMVRTLEKIERGLAKLHETRGYVRSYGEYLGRVAEVLGCAGIAVLKTGETARRTGRTWDWYSVGDGVNAVNHRIYLWHREAVEVQEAVERDRERNEQQAS